MLTKADIIFNNYISHLTTALLPQYLEIWPQLVKTSYQSRHVIIFSINNSKITTENIQKHEQKIKICFTRYRNIDHNGQLITTTNAVSILTHLHIKYNYERHIVLHIWMS